MFKLHTITVLLLGFVLFAGGCCCVGPACGPCGAACDPCCEPCCDPCCEAGCSGQACGVCSTSCCMPCICLPNPLVWVGGLFHNACMCDSGCGEIYWGGWYSDPPCCDPCDPCGNWVGGGCGKCAYSGCAVPGGGCFDCGLAADVPPDSTSVNQNGERMLTPANIAPRRAPVAPAPMPAKKSPHAMRPQVQWQR